MTELVSAADRLFHLAPELEFKAQPAYDVAAAWEVLTTGRYTNVPEAIRGLAGESVVLRVPQGELAVRAGELVTSCVAGHEPPGPVAAADAVRHLDHLLLAELAASGLPRGVSVREISRGRITLES